MMEHIMKKILFLHGFFASGSCVPALTIRNAFAGRAEVLAPDLSVNPFEALDCIRRIIDAENPDLLVGNSCGSFYAQMLAPVAGIPALLGNPHFRMTEFLEERRGEHKFKSPRRDGNDTFIVDDGLIRKFASLEARQFDCSSPYYSDKVWGLFGTKDTLAHYENVFNLYYGTAFHFPGAHTPTAEEVLEYYVPLIGRMLAAVPRRATTARYFRHFKGGCYRMERTVFDSETQKRMVVYQALYGQKAYWVRPEKMFFEKIIRDGRTINRFLEMEPD